MPDQIKVSLALARTTKNTYRFEDADEDSVCRVLYVQQSAFPGGAPKAVTVTIEAA